MNLWLFYGRALLQSQGPGLLALGVLGAVFGVTRRSPGVLLHLSFVLPFYALIAGASSSHLYYFRYIIPILPAFCLFAGLGLHELVQRVRIPRTAAALTAAVVAAVLIIGPGLAVVQWNDRHCRVDTRTQAVHWFEANVPHRGRILLEGFEEEDAQLSIPLRNTKKNARAIVERLRTTDPGKARFWELRIDTLRKPLYDLVAVRHFEPWGSLEDYRHGAVEYVVLRTDSFRPGQRTVTKFDPVVVDSRYAFYEELSSSAIDQRVAVFDASKDGAPGYDLEIWKLAPATPAAPAVPTPVPAAAETGAGAGETVSIAERTSP